MSYILSDKISIFPLAKHRVNKNNDRLFYEHNVANLIRQLIDTEGFIIRGPETVATDGLLTSELEFNLYGYHIMIESGTNLFSSNLSGDIYAQIELSTDKNVPTEIVGQDESETKEYKGLEITSTPNTSSENHRSIKLYERKETAGMVTFELCEDSLIKFKQSRVKVIGIDGKR